MSILIFFAVLFVLILVHEWGHFIVAKKTGMQVDEFGIGFPPKLFGFRWGETEYTLNLFPIGGFVKILGGNGLEANGSVDLSRSFTAKSRLAQASVLIAGVTMNVVFAWVLSAAVGMLGVPTSVDSTTASPHAELVITSVMPDTPAAAAVIPAGAVVTNLATKEVTLDERTPEAFAAFVGTHKEEDITVTYEYQDTSRSTTLKAAVGADPEDPNRAVLGIKLSLVENKQLSFTDAVVQATLRTGELLVAITVGVTDLLADTLFLQADMSQVTGPIGIVGLVGDAASFGITSLLVFTAVISLNLAVINMLPIPALDGGRLLFVAIEAVLRRPINPVWMGRVNLVGFAFLILLMIAVTYSDIMKLL